MYFLTSTDKIRPFLEARAKEVIENSKNLKGDISQNKNIFNKIGHALHALNPVFKEVTFTSEIKVII
jgi:phytanoyl-CoA hydroxylase